MVLKSGIKRLSSLEKRYEVGTYIHFIRLVGRVARLLSIVAVYGWSRAFFRRAYIRKGPHFRSSGLVVARVRLENRRNIL